LLGGEDVESSMVESEAVAREGSGDAKTGGDDVKSIMTESWAVALGNSGGAKTVLDDGDSDADSGNRMDGLAGVLGDTSVSAEMPLVLPLDINKCFWENGYKGGDNGLEALPDSPISENVTVIWLP